MADRRDLPKICHFENRRGEGSVGTRLIRHFENRRGVGPGDEVGRQRSSQRKPEEARGSQSSRSPSLTKRIAASGNEIGTGGQGFKDAGMVI